MKEYQYFGLWLEENNSLVIAQNDFLVAYGNEDALEHLLGKIQEWVKLGMPCAASFKLKIYLSDIPLEVSKYQWIVKQKDSQFLWYLK